MTYDIPRSALWSLTGRQGVATAGYRRLGMHLQVRPCPFCRALVERGRRRCPYCDNIVAAEGQNPEGTAW
jgi:hypothetical protein